MDCDLAHEGGVQSQPHDHNLKAPQLVKMHRLASPSHHRMCLHSHPHTHLVQVIPIVRIPVQVVRHLTTVPQPRHMLRQHKCCGRPRSDGVHIRRQVEPVTLGNLGPAWGGG